MNLRNNTILYVADPLCSWCYGFSEELTKVIETHKDTFNFQLLLGGLRPYNTETIADLGEMLKHHWDQVHQRSGQPFNYEILKDSTFVYDTEPPSRAVVVLRDMLPEKEYDFFKAIQHTFYEFNKNTNVVETYTDILKGYNIDIQEFKRRFESDTYKYKVKEDFAFASEIGVKGFPTTVLHTDDKLHLLANGYSTAKEINSRISEIMSAKSS